MTSTQASPQDKNTGFWKRLAHALEPLGESYEERLERRVRRLEIEMSRLCQERNDQSKSVGAVKR